MAGLLQKILELFWAPHNAPSERAYLAVFGKHPAWDDHIDDIGLETELLVQVKKLLYVEGIGGNIDSGGWDALDQKGQAIGFNHFFVWRIQEHLCIGRLSASRDGKGRTRYPLIICAHCVRMPLERAIEEVAPRLEVLQRQCAAATSASSLRAVMDAALNDLRDRIAEHHSTDSEPISAPIVDPSSQALARIASDPAMGGPEHRGLLSVLYQIHREMAEFRRESSGGRFDRISRLRNNDPLAPPQPLRVPRCANSPAEAAMLWINFFQSRVSIDTPLLLLLPVEQPWLDIIVGTPVASQLYCIRASLQTMPLTTQIPYTLEPQFLAGAMRLIEASRSHAVGEVAPSGVNGE